MNRKQRRAQKKIGVAFGPGPQTQVGPVFAEAIGLHQAGRLAEAERLYRHVLALDARHADCLHNLGAIAYAVGKHAVAAEFFQKAIAVDRDFATFHFSFGQALEQLGRLEEAIAACRTAVRLEPGLAPAQTKLGSLLLRLGQPENAETALRQAVELAPDGAEAWCDLGWTIEMRGRTDEAAECYRRAITLQPDLAERHGNSGNQLVEQGKFDDAISHYRRALGLKPDLAPLHNNLGLAWLRLGDYEMAQTCFRKALALQPDDDTHKNLIFALNFDPRCGPEQQQAERRSWYHQHACPVTVAGAAHANSRIPDRRLRIGYLSAHFRRQAAAYAFAPVLLHHDDEQFEVFCYSDTVAEDDLTQMLRSKVPHWRDVRGLSDEELGAQIREDGIDICVDLVGHMVGNRLLVMARKPAPVQVTAWGEPTGTGLPQIDWLLADPILVPQRLRPLLSEKVADLPCFLCLWTPESLPAPGPLPARVNRHMTFGSFNRLEKLTAETLCRWSAVLQAIPDSRLLIKCPALSEPANRARLTEALARSGIDLGRASMRGYTGRADHLAAYREIDLALDPYPHGGGMTTLEALAMGIPVLTAPGETISSRLAAACLSAAGMADFIADDAASLVALAAQKASDLDALAALREALPARLAASPAGDGRAYARSVEAAYRTMWRLWCDAP